MVVLRATAKVRKTLSESAASALVSDTALGDWYVNRVVVSRKPLLLLVSAKSLLPILTPARDVRSLPTRLGDVVGHRLRRLGVDAKLIEAELGAMMSVEVAKTSDRSVLGVMVDFAKAMPSYFASCGYDAAGVWEVEAMLAETPCYSGPKHEEVVFPDRKAPKLLAAKWGGCLTRV